MINWKRQNRLQVQGRKIYEFFKPSICNYETYRPKIKKWRMGLGIGVITFCMVTPCTNWMIPSVVRWMIK